MVAQSTNVCAHTCQIVVEVEVEVAIGVRVVWVVVIAHRKIDPS